MEKRLVEVKNLKKHFVRNEGIFRRKKTYVKAVDNVSFHIEKGETLGLVGESGCGKSTTGRTLIRLYDVTGGEVIYDGNDISKLTNKELRPYRKKMQMIFQDPYASLNSRMTVSDLIGEPIDLYEKMNRKERRERIFELLNYVGLQESHANRYPHEFSGGQRQRIGIARALAVRPEFIICDEPISALDVSIQAQVVNMLEELQEKLNLTYLFIAHDLSMVRHISDRIGVMYLGNLVEVGNSEEVYRHPLHPYTKALLSAVPIPDPILSEKIKPIMLEGDVPTPINPPNGCRFNTRCPYAQQRCREEFPYLKKVSDTHEVACHFV